MTNSKKLRGRLELNWVNKDKSLLYEYDEEGNPVRPKKWVDKDDIRVSEPRILKLKKQYGENDNENMLIKGDNLLALRSLTKEFRNRREEDKVKLIYIDPPFNTGSAFEYYKDNLEHSEWLSMMRDRLLLLKKLLRKDGAIFVHIDHREMHYLKVLMDELFGRSNYVGTIVVKMRHPKRILLADKDLHDITEYVLFYCKDHSHFKPRKEIMDVSNFDPYVYEVVEKAEGTTIEIKGEKVKIFKKYEYELVRRENPSKSLLRKINIRESIMDRNSTTRYYRDYLKKRLEKDGHGTLYKVPGIGADALGYRYILQPREGHKNGNYLQGYPLNKKDFKEIPLPNFIDVSEVTAREGLSKEGGVKFPKGKKPEILIKKLFDFCNVDDGDLVLDSFAGSGTTGAVAHKMGLRWILIEMGKEARTKCLARMKNVISQKKLDRTGIGKKDNIDWQGGGGFRYYELGGSLISDKSEINWKLTKEEIARGVFMNFGYTFEEKLEDGVFVGNDKEKYAVCAVTKRPTLMGKAEIEGIIEKLEAVYGKNNVGQIDIYTNQGIKVKDEYLPGNVNTKKIPNAILERYNI